ncbi:MAG TPA: PEP/pyruvate-binding domain-containing protein [Chloroflexota bacterium]|nr:PEP/pyruvate-binding domain-containing protein [Chloroflexota bacterium]
MVDPSLIVPLEALRGNDVERAGGKAANLGELIAGGFPVPPGFCVTVQAYSQVTKAAGLAESIEAALQTAGSAEDAASRIADLFEGLSMPDDLAASIAAAYRELGAPPVAVRSSATAEDQPDASFAGQQASFLNVRGEEALLAAVRRCWASLWTARAIAYRERVGYPHAAAAMAVVVQRLVEAEAAGVLFTANPASGARDEIVVNAARGLGEAVVNGATTPDTWRLERATLAVLERQTGRQRISTILTESGIADAPLEVDRASHPALDDGQLASLARLGLGVERHFGSPQDVEWAVAGGRFWIVQARPITNLPPQPLKDARWEPPFPGSAWVRRQVTENMPEPLSPLFEELYLTQGLESSIDAIMALFARNLPTLRLDDFVDRPFFATVNGYAYERADFKLSLRMLWTTLRVTIGSFGIMFKEGVPYWRDRALPAYRARIEQWKQVDPATTPEDPLLAAIRELAWADAEYWYACAVVVGSAKITDGLLDRFLAKAAPRRGLTSGHFMRGFPSLTLDAEAELERLAEQIRSSGELARIAASTPAERLAEALGTTDEGRAVLADLDGYLERNGHQIYNLDFVVPTQIDDPLPVLLSLKAMAQRPGQNVRARQRQIARERDGQALATWRSFDPFRRRLFKLCLGWARRFGPYREQALFYLGAAWPTLRRLALELGRRLVERGSLEAPDDVFFLRTAEIQAAIGAPPAATRRGDLASLARERRDLREARKRLHPPPAVPPDYRLRFGPLDMSVWETQRRNAPDSLELRGFAVSPGRVVAPASRVMSPDEFAKMEPGTILVCPATTPAWTPLFAQARGLVTDVGGILAHGSIIAREYGIPAVMGTGDGTERIHHGQTIAVDGDRGLVVLSPLPSIAGP